MEQITVTLSREALEQLPQNVLVGLLLGQPAQSEQAPPAPTNDELVTLFPAETVKTPARHNQRWSSREDLNLMYGYSKGHLSDLALAEMLNRSVDSVRVRIGRLKRAGKL